jgi:hypothetical protein
MPYRCMTLRALRLPLDDPGWRRKGLDGADALFQPGPTCDPLQPEEPAGNRQAAGGENGTAGTDAGGAQGAGNRDAEVAGRNSLAAIDGDSC